MLCTKNFSLAFWASTLLSLGHGAISPHEPTREQEMHQALERRDAASDAVSAAKQRLRQLVSAQDAFVTPIRRPVGVDVSAQVVTPLSLEDPKPTAVHALSKPSNFPEVPPPPGLSSSPFSLCSVFSKTSSFSCH